MPSRVLYISAAPPVPSKIGPARRNFHIIDQLARFFELSVLSVGTATQAALFAETFGDRVRSAGFVPPSREGTHKFGWKVWRTMTGRCDFAPAADRALRQRCSELLRDGEYDAIVLSCQLLRGLPLPSGLPIVADTHNVEFDVLRRTAACADDWAQRAYASAQWPATRREERHAAHSAELLLATSDRDRRVFEDELTAPRVEVVPNGIDLDEFSLSLHEGRPDTILFTGLMSYYPNQQAIRWFLDQIFPFVLQAVPRATLVIAGANPPSWLLDRANARVHVTGPVPDMRPYLESASVFVAPLRIGGGTRVKILEALATGRPVVSTTVGAEGLRTGDGESILIADEPEAFARHVAHALTNRELARHLAVSGRRQVEEHYDWDTIGDHLCRLLETSIGLVPRRRSRVQREMEAAQ